MTTATATLTAPSRSIPDRIAAIKRAAQKQIDRAAEADRLRKACVAAEQRITTETANLLHRHLDGIALPDGEVKVVPSGSGASIRLDVGGMCLCEFRAESRDGETAEIGAGYQEDRTLAGCLDHALLMIEGHLKGLCEAEDIPF